MYEQNIFLLGHSGVDQAGLCQMIWDVKSVRRWSHSRNGLEVIFVSSVVIQRLDAAYATNGGGP